MGPRGGIIAGMYKRRIVALLVIIVLVLAVLAGKLFFVQVLRADGILDDAAQHLSRLKLLPAIRGRILDRAGRILAFDKPCHDLCLDFRLMIAPQGRPAGLKPVPDQGGNLSRIAAKWLARQRRKIAAELGCSTDRAAAVLARRLDNTWRLARQAAVAAGVDLDAAVEDQVSRISRMTRSGRRDYRALYQSHPVVRGLDRSQAAGVQAELPGTVGMEVRPSHVRQYPRRRAACHLIGITGPVSAADLERLNRPRYEPDWLTWQRDSYLGNDMIGRTGVERMCETLLKGRRGYRIYRAGEPVGEVTSASPGGDVHLTVDIELQQALAKAFADSAVELNIPNATGAIVVLDVPTGEVLALVSVPTFDLNRYRKDYPQLIADRVSLPLRNRAVGQCYAPGSSVKPIVALSALAEGVITRDTTFVCDGGIFPLSANGSPKCWIAKHGGGHGRLDLVGGLCHSCNVYFDYVGNLLGPDRLCQWYRLFGFGSRPGTGLPEESAGLVPTDRWMLQVEKRHMSAGDAWNMAIGQGSLLASPLQVANAMATIARGGQFVSPMISLEMGPPRRRNHLPISRRQMQAVQEGMWQVVNSPAGTAHKALVRAGLKTLGVEFCGKTGTAQVSPQKVDLDGDGLRETAVRWGDVVWFAGFAPYRRPKIAFVVMIEYVDRGAGTLAGPLALRVVRICKDMGYLRPSD